MLSMHRSRRESDAGFTLIELMIVTVIFGIILAIVTGAIVTMLHQEQRESGQANNLDASRKVIQSLDHSVRYANAITTPGTGTDGSYYVEWQTGNVGQQQTCTQWRWVPAGGKLQWRTWLPPLTGSATPTATAWAVEAIGIGKVGTTPIFAFPSATQMTTNAKEQLVVNFTSTSGAPSTTASSQVSLTAINSTSSSAPTAGNGICTQIGRP